jgi:tetratricopeptide (TPR) repeat protein
MSAEAKSNLPLEIAHVLFIDIVGYSKLLIDDQHDAQHQLSRIVRSTNEFRVAERDGKLVRLPTGDGMALVFFSNPEAPVQCATEITKALKNTPTFELRMGIHSGAVSGVTDVNERSNVAGAGINMAQRVMDCGDAGHILLSKRAAEDLTQYSRWHQYLHDLGECEVKHGVVVSLFSLYNEEIGNSEIPKGIKQRRSGRAGRSVSTQAERIFGRKQVLGIVALLLFLSAIVIWLVQAQRRQVAVIQSQGEQVGAILERNQKMQQALVRLAQVEAQSKQPGEKLTPEEQRARAYAMLEKELGLSAGTLAKEMPGFALELYSRADTTPLIRARAAYALNKFDEAEKLSLEAGEQDQKAYETANRVADERRKSALEAYELAGSSAEKRVQYADALEHLRKAEQLTDRARDPLEWARVQFAIGWVLYDQGQYQQVESVLREVLKERERLLGPEHLDAIATRHYIARAVLLQGRYAEAEAELRKVLTIRGNVLGPEHPDTLMTRNGLANAALVQGKYAEAEAEYRAVLKLRQKVLGVEDPQTLTTRSNLAVTLDREGRYAEAEAEYREVLKLREKVLGAGHPDTLAARDNLAVVLQEGGKYAEAETEVRIVLKLREKSLGTEHPRTLQTRGNLAIALDNEGKYAEAEAENRALLKIVEKVLGPEHPDTSEMRNNLADALVHEGKYAEGESEYRAVIKLRQKVLGQEHPDTMKARNGLANVFVQEGKYADGEAEYRAVLKFRQKILGPEHPDTLVTQGGLAIAIAKQQRYTEAELTFSEVLPKFEKAWGIGHPVTLELCEGYAECLKGEGKLPQAKELAQRAADGARKVLGPDHPNTKKYEKLLAELEGYP